VDSGAPHSARHRARLDTRRAVVRIAISFAVGVASYLVVARRVPAVAATLVGWDTAALVLLALSWSGINHADAQTTRQRAGSEDPGRTLVYVIVVVTSSVSLLAATLLLRNAGALPVEFASGLVALCLVTVGLAWTTTHAAFTFRYAHLYYREDAEGVGGVDLPGKEPPTYFDFAYFAFTIGMCFQVSDICVTSRQIRRAVLLHAIISFAYNSVILAFILSLVFGAAR
jgi:uncharacterized membrane protein